MKKINRRYKIQIKAESLNADTDELLAQYQDQGYSMLQVGKMLDVSPGSIADYLKSKGIVWKRRDFSMKTAIIKMAETGSRTQTIARKLGCSLDHVRKIRRQFGLPQTHRKSGPKKKYVRRVLPNQWAVEERWGMPIRQLIQDLVDQGFSLRKVSLVLGCGRETVRAHAKGIVLPPKEL